MAYAPSTLRWLANQWETAIGSAVLSGIVGDSQHTYGYHCAPDQLPSSDYSLQLAGDRNGVDRDAASAIDVSHNPAEQRMVTQRFYNSWKDSGDLRLNHVREVIGTLDGRNVIYMDTQSGRQGTADSSHLWHVHVGGLRSNMLTQHAMDAILSIVKGESWAQYAAAHPDDPYVHGSPHPAPTPSPAPQPHPAPGPGYGFPLPAGWYFGPKSGPAESVSGYYGRVFAGRTDRWWLQEWANQLGRRGWSVGQGRQYLGRYGNDGYYGDEYAALAKAFQRDQHLTGDGLIGSATWWAAYHNPVT